MKKQVGLNQSITIKFAIASLIGLVGVLSEPSAAGQTTYLSGQGGFLQTLQSQGAKVTTRFGEKFLENNNAKAEEDCQKGSIISRGQVYCIDFTYKTFREESGREVCGPKGYIYMPSRNLMGCISGSSFQLAKTAKDSECAGTKAKLSGESFCLTRADLTKPQSKENTMRLNGRTFEVRQYVALPEGTVERTGQAVTIPVSSTGSN